MLCCMVLAELFLEFLISNVDVTQNWIVPSNDFCLQRLHTTLQLHDGLFIGRHKLLQVLLSLGINVYHNLSVMTVSISPSIKNITGGTLRQG